MHVSRSWTGRAVGLVSPSLAPGDHHGPGTSKAVSGLGAFEGPLLPYHSCRSSFSQPCRHAFPSTTRRLRSSPLRHGTLYSNARRLWWLASLFQVVMCMHLGPWMSQGVSATHSGDAPPHSGHILDHLTKRSGHSIMSFPRGLSDDRLPEHEEKVTTLESAHDTSREKLTFTRVEETETNTYEAQDGLYSRSAVQSLKFQHDWSRARPPLGSDSLSPTISPARDFYGFEASPHARAVGLNGSRSALLSSVDLGTAEDGLEFGTGTPLDESAEKSFHRTDRLLHLGSRRLLAQESGPDSSGSSTDEPQKSKDGDSGRATMLTHHNDPEWKGESTPAPSADRGNSTRHETIDRGDGTSMSDTKDDGGQWGSTHRGRQQPDQEQGESELRGQAVQQQGPLISGSDVQDTQRETGVMNPSRWETASTTGGGREAGNTGTSLPSSVGRSAWWGPPHAVSRGTDRSGEIKVKKRSTEQLFQSSRNGFEALFSPHVKERLCLKVLMHNSTSRMFAVLLLLHLEWPTFTSYRQGTEVFLMNLRRKATSFDEYRDSKYTFLDHCPLHRILAKGLNYLADQVSKYSDLLALKKEMQSSSREFRHSVRHLPAIKKQASSRPGLFQALLVAWDLFSTSILKFKLFGAVDPEAPGKSVLYFMDLSERLLDLWFKERSFDVTMLWAYLIHSRVVDSKTHRRPQQSTSILLMDGMRDYLFGELPHHKLGAGILYTSRQLDALRLLEDRVKDAVHRKLQNALRRYQSFPLASEATLLLRRETGWLQRIGAAAPEAVFPALFTDKLLPSVQVTGYFLRGERGEEVKTGIFGDGISDELLEELKAGLPAHSALLQLTMVDAWAWHTRSRDPRDSEPAGQRILGETQGQRRLSATVGSASQSAPLPPRSAYAEPADGSGVADASSEQHLEQRGESSPTEFFEQPSAPSCFGEGAASSQPHGLCADPVALDSYLPVTTATQLLNVELRWDPSLLNAIGRTVVLLSDVVDLDNADLHGPEGDPAFDLDVHALLLLPVRDFTGAEGLAQDVVRMVSSGPASSRLPGGGQTTSERAKQLLNPRRVKVLGTARWVGGSAPKLLLGEFGVGICTKGLQDALALLEKGFVLVHLSIAGLSRGFQKSMHSVGETAEAGTGGSLNARRGAEAKATTAGQMSAATGRVWGISAKEAFRRFLRRTKGGAARIVYMQTSAEDGIKAAAEKSQRREGRVPFTGMVISNACVVAFFVLVILYLQWTKRADMPWWITCLCMRSAPWLLADENLDVSSVSSSEKEESCNCSDAGDAQVSTAATDEFPVRRKRSSSLTSCRLGAAIAHKASCYPVSVCPPMSEGEQHAASQSYFLSPLAPLPVLKNPRRRTLRAAVAMQRCVKLKRNHGLAASSPESIPCPVGRVSCVSPPQQYRSARKSPSVVGSPLEPYPGPTHVANRLLSGLDWAQKERENSDVNAAVALQSAPRGGDPRIQNYTNGERGDGGAYGAPSKQGRAPWSLEGKAGQKSSRRRGLAFGCRSHTKDNACVSTDSRDAGLLGEQVLGGGGRTAFSKWGWREESVAIPVSSEAAGKSIHLPEYADKRASSKDGVPSEQAQEPHKEEPEGMGQNEEECDLELVVRFVDSDGRRASWV